MDVEEYMKYAEKISNSSLISIDTKVGIDEDSTTSLWQILSINDDVITLYYYEELSMKEIGEILGLTESRISQIHTKTMLKIRNMISKYLTKD